MLIIEHHDASGDLAEHPTLPFLERQSDSDTVTVYLHGLGLDADDYRDCLNQRDEHGLAVTMRGFQPGSAPLTEPTSVDTHVRLVSEFVKTVAADHPTKRLSIVGFSLGADMILRLAEHWRRDPESAPRVDSLLLLDPNINQTTMTISRLIAEADADDVSSTFDRIRNLAPDNPALDNYVRTITDKDFAQLRQLSEDTLAYWQPQGHEQIGQRLAAANDITPRIRVVFSADYENDLDEIVEAADLNGAFDVSFGIIDGDHFALITSEVLFPELDALKAPSLTQQPRQIQQPGNMGVPHPASTPKASRKRSPRR